MSEFPRPKPFAKLKLSLKGILVGVTFVAMACAMTMQSLRFAETKAALSRYETSVIPLTLEPNQFRLIMHKVLQTNHANVITYRIESVNDHFATIGVDRDSNGCRATYDQKTNLHFSEAVILIDHFQSKNGLKVMAKLGAEGYSVWTVSDDFSLDNGLSIHGINSVYSRDAIVELLELNGRSITLKLTP